MDSVKSGSGILSKPPVPLAKPAHELELDRKKALLAKVKVLREGAMFNKGAVLEGNPAKQYCWVNCKDDRRVTYEAMGWEVVKDPAVKTRWRQEDGTHRRADLILYSIDKEMFEAMMAYNSLRGIEAVEGSEEMFLAALDRDKVPAYKPQIR
jgi:hypothetical protein